MINEWKLRSANAHGTQGEWPAEIVKRMLEEAQECTAQQMCRMQNDERAVLHLNRLMCKNLCRTAEAFEQLESLISYVRTHQNVYAVSIMQKHGIDVKSIFRTIMST